MTRALRITLWTLALGLLADPHHGHDPPDAEGLGPAELPMEDAQAQAPVLEALSMDMESLVEEDHPDGQSLCDVGCAVAVGPRLAELQIDAALQRADLDQGVVRGPGQAGVFPGPKGPAEDPAGHSFDLPGLAGVKEHLGPAEQRDSGRAAPPRRGLARGIHGRRLAE